MHQVNPRLNLVQMPGVLEVTVIEAHGIQDVEQWGKQDDYCTLRLSEEPQATAASAAVLCTKT